jgi:imidazole glycerol-phosphate synthase subunit HisF
MLKRRIIPVQLILNGRLVKSVQFEKPRDVGDPVKSSKVYSDQDADELFLLNIGGEGQAFDQLVNALGKIARSCYVPLTVGGGIRSIDDARRLFDVGCDKVSLCSQAFGNPALIEQIAKSYGSQAVVVCVDVVKSGDGYELRSSCGKKSEMASLEDHLASVENHGAGEIVIQSIDRDGTMTGYDKELIALTCSKTQLPVIALGGAGLVTHLHEALQAGASAVACGSYFNFGDNNPLRAKAALKNYGVPLKRV